MAESTPELFPLNESGQGAVLIAGTNQIAMPATPAKSGEYLVIYANGLGPVAERVVPGVPAPTDHTVLALNRITVVLGGIEYTPAFAGLAPGMTGLFQVNAGLTGDLPVGDAVPLYLKVTQSDGSVTSSNTVTVAIQGAP